MFKTFILFKKQKNGRIKKKKKSGSWWKSTKGERKKLFIHFICSPTYFITLISWPKRWWACSCFGSEVKAFFYWFLRIFFCKPLLDIVSFFIYFSKKHKNPTHNILPHLWSFISCFCLLLSFFPPNLSRL